MYVQTRKAGIKHFVLVIAALAVSGTVISRIRLFLPVYRLVTDLLTVAVFAGIGYVVLLKYASVFEYGTDGDFLYLERRVGHRTKRIEIKTNQIKKITRGKRLADFPKNYSDMCVSVFSKKDRYYLVYRGNKETCGVIFEPDSDFLRVLGGKYD